MRRGPHSNATGTSGGNSSFLGIIFLPNNASPGKGMGRETLDAEIADHQKSSRQLLDLGLMKPGRNIEIGEIDTTEGTGSRFKTRQIEAAQLLSGSGIVTNDAGTVTESDPKMAIFVDGHSIRRRIVGRS